MTTREVLRAARDRLAQPGVWVNHSPKEGEHCLLTAVGEDWQTGSRRAIQLLEEVTGSGLWAWNDHPDRTLPEVLAVLEEAIERA